MQKRIKTAENEDLEQRRAGSEQAFAEAQEMDIEASMESGLEPEQAHELDATQKEALYLTLAQLFLYEVDTGLQQQLNAIGLGDLLEAMAPGCADWLAQPLDEAETERLACLYADLFLVGKSSISLQASTWLQGEPELAAGIEALVRSADPEAVEALGNLPTDHLGVLLCYLAGSWMSERSETRAMASELTVKLLGGWVEPFAEKLEQLTQEPIYLAGVRLLVELVGVECDEALANASS